MSKKLATAIIGAGNIAGGFDKNKLPDEEGIFTHAGAYTKSDKFSLDVVFDSDLKKSIEFKEAWKVKSCAKNMDEITSAFFDVISVCTPDFSHYDIIKSLLIKKCCKTIFAEKPLSLNLQQIEEIIQLSKQNEINVVVDFQRRFDSSFSILQNDINKNPKDLLTVNGYYIKGLEHIGITMIDTIIYLLGFPSAVFTYNKIFNQEINDYSYEFILFYPDFNATIKTADSPIYRYNYHIFEIDLLFSNSRKTINYNSQLIETKEVINYAYAGVKTLNDKAPVKRETDYKRSLLNAAEYIYKVTKEGLKHTINTPESSYNNKLIADQVINSYNKQQKIDLKETVWKK